jgi:hypothetical protein
MTMAFAGLSRMPYVRTLRCWHRRPDRVRINDPRLWAVKFKITPSSPGHLQIDHRVFNAARRRVGWVRPLLGYTFYAWLPDLPEAWASVFAPAPTPPAKVELVGKTQVQLVEKPTSRAKAQPPPQLTEKQIQAWMMLVAPMPKPGSTDEKLRRYAVKKYRERWTDKNPADAMKAAENDPEYEKEVGVIRYGISTWRRAFGRKDRQK